MSRLRPRYTEQFIAADPLELAMAAQTAREEAARAKITAGAPTPDPQDLRGIPVVGRGIGGTSPGTNPLSEVCRQ